MKVLQGIHASFCFWNGLQESTKRKVLMLTAVNPSMDALAVFQPPKGDFSRIDNGMTPPLRPLSLFRFLFFKCSVSPAFLRTVFDEIILILQF